MVGTVATGSRRRPWGLTFLPDGTALVGERDTTRVLAIDGRRVRAVGRVGGVQPQGEAGLLGLATSPTYAEDRLVYAYLSTARDNRVVTMTYDGRPARRAEPVLTGIPNGFVHDGGRLLFAPDGNLFVSTGETGDRALAQDRDSLGGKILRITADGEPAPGNPVAGLPRLDDGPPQRAGPGLRRRGPAVGDRVRPGHLGRAQPDPSRGRNYGWPLVEGRGDAGRSTATRSCSGAPTTRPRPASPTSTARSGLAPCAAGGCGRCR